MWDSCQSVLLIGSTAKAFNRQKVCGRTISHEITPNRVRE
jgi:hypothetical protein